MPSSLRNGRSQTRFFENFAADETLTVTYGRVFSSREVILHKEGETLVIEPLTPKNRLLQVLATLKPLREDFPDVNKGLPGLDDIKL